MERQPGQPDAVSVWTSLYLTRGPGGTRSPARVYGGIGGAAIGAAGIAESGRVARPGLEPDGQTVSRRTKRRYRVDTARRLVSPPETRS